MSHITTVFFDFGGTLVEPLRPAEGRWAGGPHGGRRIAGTRGPRRRDTVPTQDIRISGTDERVLGPRRRIHPRTDRLSGSRRQACGGPRDGGSGSLPLG